MQPVRHVIMYTGGSGIRLHKLSLKRTVALVPRVSALERVERVDDGIAFRKVPTGILRNETVSGRKRFAWRRRQCFVDCFVRIEVLCGFTVGLVRLFRFYLSISSRFAK